MKDQELRVNILLSLQRALLGNISSHVRMICCDWETNQWFKLRFYLDIEPNEIERELMSVVLTEFECDIRFERFFEECIYSNEPFGQLDPLKATVYARDETSSFG
jgi:predicted DNA-binding ribbon-helix-helix protein